ncbi:MAG: hypothetical protein CSA81_04190 [Acidobacteria bacterium]|nr:MAG: hypothetical protein CSA81_04190 [Acidobacteriota bacterium]
MILSLLFFVLIDQHLTWYENFEQGEKLFKEGRYEQAIPLLQHAVEAKETPRKKAFTRAVQTIEYKPYYYLALSHHRLGNLEEAYRKAQKALEGEVVNSSAIYMDRLSPIIEAYLDYVKEKNEKYESIQLAIDRKLSFLQALGVQNFTLASSLLEHFNGQEKTDMENLLLRHSNLHEKKLQMDGWLDQYRKTLEDLIQAGDKTQAQALLKAMKPILSTEEFQSRQQSIELLPEPAIQVPAEISVEESTKDQEIKKLIAKMQQERTDLEKLLERDQLEISNLSVELRNLRSQSETRNSLDLHPEVTLTVQVQNRNLSCAGQFLTPNGFQQGFISAGNQKFELQHKHFSGMRTASFEKTFESLPYGSGVAEVQITDERGNLVRKESAFQIQRPWYLSPLFYISWSLLIVLYVLFLFIRAGRKRKRAILNHFNPYIAGVPVLEKDMFFGREKLMARIEKLIQNNCLMIFGQRRIGKTSLLHQLHDRLKLSQNPNATFFPVFIDLQGVKEQDLFHIIMGETLSSYPELESELALSFEDTQESYTSRQFSKDLKMIIEHLQDRNPRHIHIVFLMDEVDAINDFSEKTNQKLRGIFMKTFSDHLSSIMAGIHLKKHWESSGSPWYNFFEEIPMTYIQEKAARDLITVPVKGVFTFEEPAIDLIIQESGCQPFLIQKICVSLINQQLERKSLKRKRFKISFKDVEYVLSTMRDERKIIEGVQSS